MPDIHHEITIKVSPEKVFDALTSQKGLAAWWTKETTAKPEVGSVNVFKFGGEARTEMTVTSLTPNTIVEWKCIKSDGLGEWVGTTLSFHLAAQPNHSTLVRFTHADWKARSELFGVNDKHWLGYLKSLKAFCQTGKGTSNFI